MELDDVFYIGRRPATLRMVLGLMEDADNSLETYHWATPALLHSIYTNDRLLSQYVEEVFQRKGLTPYAPYKKDEDKTTEKTPEKMVMDKHVMWSKAKMAVEELMSLKDAKGGDLFCQKNHWWAVFRIFVDLQGERRPGIDGVIYRVLDAQGVSYRIGKPDHVAVVTDPEDHPSRAKVCECAHGLQV